MSITVENITKKYEAQIAVDRISFQLKKNEIVGFLGPNGAGKSTTMKMITGYLKPDSGDILVCGLPVGEGQTATRQKIGYLPESNPLYFDMYVKEYLSFVGSLYQVDRLSHRIPEVINLVGLGAESHKKIGALSKGYKQRVGLAAALVHDPEVLILDEPTSGLDPNQIVEIRSVIKQLGTEKTVLFSSHIMQEVEALCERVIIIHKGKMVADDLLSNLKSGNADKHQIVVNFKEKIDASSLINALEDASVHTTDGYGFIVETDQPETTKKRILQYSLDHNLNISSIQTENQQLEDIFRNLTQPLTT